MRRFDADLVITVIHHWHSGVRFLPHYKYQSQFGGLTVKIRLITNASADLSEQSSNPMGISKWGASTKLRWYRKTLPIGVFVFLVTTWLPYSFSPKWPDPTESSTVPVIHASPTVLSTSDEFYRRQTNKTLSTTEMFVALSDMLPDHQGSCPNLPHYPAQWFDLRDLRLCYNVLRRASDHKECIIYNFGVGNRDPFLEFMSSDKHLHCQVYAFDPFVPPDTLKMKFGPNIHFYEIGLWNGQSDRLVGRRGTGRLMTFGEIQAMLNHTSETRITLFRSDCEGCEYGWVKHAMDQNETFFERIDQMFIEIHTVPIRFMSSISLDWKDGMPPTDLLEPVYQMMTKYFRVLHAAVNPGGPTDRNRVPASLTKAGVLKYPCCREFNLINRHLAAPPDYIKDNEKDCPVTDQRVPPVDLEGFRGDFRTLFRGRHKTCPGNMEAKCIHDQCYCPSILDKDVEGEKCHVYFFGSIGKSGRDVILLKEIYQSHPRCSIRVFDPRLDEARGDALMKEQGMPEVMFYPWGLYGGAGPRRLHDIPGEFYTMAEITTSWLKIQSVKRSSPNPSPTHISLMRIDWSMANPCKWQNEILAHSTAWWGQYKGAETVQQLL